MKTKTTHSESFWTKVFMHHSGAMFKCGLDQLCVVCHPCFCVVDPVWKQYGCYRYSGKCTIKWMDFSEKDTLPDSSRHLLWVIFLLWAPFCSQWPLLFDRGEGVVVLSCTCRHTHTKRSCSPCCPVNNRKTRPDSDMRHIIFLFFYWSAGSLKSRVHHCYYTNGQ